MVLGREDIGLLDNFIRLTLTHRDISFSHLSRHRYVGALLLMHQDPVLHSLENIVNSRQRLNLYLNLLKQILCRVAAVRDHESHRLAVEPHLLLGENRLVSHSVADLILSRDIAGRNQVPTRII
ncbi:hypothetical protein HRbin03_00256 [archaeon HR03]|nr:hypothetical protein HRbin03_00256 [archaeon HR03]